MGIFAPFVSLIFKVVFDFYAGRMKSLCGVQVGADEGSVNEKNLKGSVPYPTFGMENCPRH